MSKRWRYRCSRNYRDFKIILMIPFIKTKMNVLIKQVRIGSYPMNNAYFPWYHSFKELICINKWYIHINYILNNVFTFGFISRLLKWWDFCSLCSWFSCWSRLSRATCSAGAMTRTCSMVEGTSPTPWCTKDVSLLVAYCVY